MLGSDRFLHRKLLALTVIGACNLISLHAVGGEKTLGAKRFEAKAISPDHIAVLANGIPVPMRLAGIDLSPLKDTKHYEDFAKRTQKYVEDDLKRAKHKVRIEIAKDYDYRSGGVPVVYAYVVHLKHDILLNKRPILKGYAYADTTDLQKDKTLSAELDGAQRVAQKHQLGMWKPDIAEAITVARNRAAHAVKSPAPASAPPPAANPTAAVSPPAPSTAATTSGIRPDRFYAEKGARSYYAGSNAWVKRINPKRLVEYETEEAAQAAGLKPVRSATKSKKSASSPTSAGIGKLIGIKQDKLFHTHACALVKKQSARNLVFYEKLASAKGEGRTACHSCMRLDIPNWPQPEDGECGGRAEPYFRPCLRPAFKETGICKRCSGHPRGTE